MGAFAELRDLIRMSSLNGACVAFSGGVDSALVLKVACVYGKNIHAVTFNTRLHPRADVLEAKRLAQEYGAVFYEVDIDEFSDETIMQNSMDRCYRCKRLLLTELKKYASRMNIGTCMDGTNADDLNEYRPGIWAAKELEIISPLAELGITKSEVRELASKLGLSVSSKPSSPCLATRLPYNTNITTEILERIGNGEIALKSIGFSVVRLRVHGDIARIEIPKVDFNKFMVMRDRIIKTLKDLGFVYITLDLEGFRSGSMDIDIK